MNVSNAANVLNSMQANPTSAPIVRLDLVPHSDEKLVNSNLNSSEFTSNKNNLAPPVNNSPTKCKNSTKNFRLSSRSVQLGNLVRTKLYSSFPNLPNNTLRKDPLNSKWYQDVDENINRVLKAVASDHVVSTPTEDNKNRRTVFIERKDEEKFGFIIQSYAFRRRNKIQMEQITYVDYVALDGPGYRAGLRAGDVILAINGKNIQSYSHKQLIRYIVDCKTLRMVVLFENCVNRIELCARAIKLKKLLSDKEFELKTLNLQQDRLLKGLPLFTEEEILTLIRTPCNSPTIERVSNYSDVNSITSDALSSIGIASSSSIDEVDEEQIDGNDVKVSNLVDGVEVEEDVVNFVLGSESSSASIRSSVYSKHSSTLAEAPSSTIIEEDNCARLDDIRLTVPEEETSIFEDDFQFVEADDDELPIEENRSTDDSTSVSMGKLRVDSALRM